MHLSNYFQPQSIYLHMLVCVCVLVTLYGRCRGRAAWRWCLPAPARLNRWHIPQSLWTGCPLRKTIQTETKWEKQTSDQSLITFCTNICLTSDSRTHVVSRWELVSLCRVVVSKYADIYAYFNNRYEEVYFGVACLPAVTIHSVNTWGEGLTTTVCNSLCSHVKINALNEVKQTHLNALLKYLHPLDEA